MRVAICDDEIKWVNIIKERIEKLYCDEKTELYIDCFTNQEDLLTKARYEKYQIVYLDIEMEGTNGITVGRKLKELNEFCIVVFVSGYDSYIPDAFRVEAFQFIKKEEFDTLFDIEFYRAIDAYKKKNLIRTFKVREGRVTFNLNEIICIESYYNSVFIKTTRGTYITNYENLKKIREEVLDYDFIRIQVGLIVNMNYIVSMKYREIELVSGEYHPISMVHYRKVMEKYHRFLSLKKCIL